MSHLELALDDYLRGVIQPGKSQTYGSPKGPSLKSSQKKFYFIASLQFENFRLIS